MSNSLIAAITEALSWNPPEVQARAAKEKKERKQFASAKREITRQKRKENKPFVMTKTPDWYQSSLSAKIDEALKESALDNAVYDGMGGAGDAEEFDDLKRLHQEFGNIPEADWREGISSEMPQDEAGLESRLRKLRSKVFDFGDEAYAEIEKEMEATKAALLAVRSRGGQGPTGPYSGLTRSELRRSGTAETDWY